MGRIFWETVRRKNKCALSVGALRYLNCHVYMIPFNDSGFLERMIEMPRANKGGPAIIYLPWTYLLVFSIIPSIACKYLKQLYYL